MRCFELGKPELDIIQNALEARQIELNIKIGKAKNYEMRIELLRLKQMVEDLIEYFS